jgi:hypothetical protein
VHRLIQNKADGKLVELSGPIIDEELKEEIIEVGYPIVIFHSTSKQQVVSESFASSRANEQQWLWNTRISSPRS